MDLRQAHFPLLDRHFRASRAEQSHHHRLNHERSRLTFLREVDIVNMRRRTRMVELTREACSGSLLGARVAVLGAAFKPESDDVRDSPALNVAGQIQLQGASVTVYDPKANQNARSLSPTLNWLYATKLGRRVRIRDV